MELFLEEPVFYVINKAQIKIHCNRYLDVGLTSTKSVASLLVLVRVLM